jgi:hypothetical protein
VIGVPSSGGPIDKLSITAGHAFARDTSSNVAVVEQHTADDLGITPGESVQALGIGSVEELKVTGVGVSPEYLLPAQSQQQIVTAPGSFAVLYVPRVKCAQSSSSSCSAYVANEPRSTTFPRAACSIPRSKDFRT